jgi:tetratricopeptide (TPR) repeat protein
VKRLLTDGGSGILPPANNGDNFPGNDLHHAQRLAAVCRHAEARSLLFAAAEREASGPSIAALGSFLFRQGELPEARRQFERLLGLAHAQDCDEWRIVAHHNLAAVCRELGEDHRARVHQQHAWRLSLDRGVEPDQLQSGWRGLANDALLARDWPLAAQLWRLALEFDLRHGTAADLADSWGGCGIAEYGRGDIAAALVAFRRALRLHRLVNDVIGAGKDLLHLAKCLAAQNNWRRAWRIANLAARCFDQAQHAPLKSEARRFCKSARGIVRITQTNAALN